MSARQYQTPMFTVRGNAARGDAARRDLRTNVLESLADVFGSTTVDEACPECNASPLRVVLHSTSPVAYCECGFFLEINQ